MLDRFTVKAFKSLEDVTVHFGIVNVLIGANGSGKSNLLEAVGILGAAASGRVNDESLKYRGVRPGRPALYKSSFRNLKQPFHIRFEADSETASFAVSLLNPIANPTPDWAYKHERLMRGHDEVAARGPKSQGLNKFAGLSALRAVELAESDPAGMFLELLRNYAIYSPDTPTLRGLEPDLQSRPPVGLAGGRLPEALQELLLKLEVRPQLTQAVLLVDWLSKTGVGRGSQVPISASLPQQSRTLRFKDKFMSETRNWLSGYDASEGVLYLLFGTVLALHDESPRLFAIDNFDQALNPRLAREFTRCFCEWILASGDRQALLTTHNPLVLDGLPLLNDKIRLFAVDRNRRGATVVNRVVVTKEIMAAAEAGTPLSQQWVMGHFGGVPANV